MVRVLERCELPEAVTVLKDDFALTRDDAAAIDEARFVALGLGNEANQLVVVYASREPDVISAWKANKRQRHLNEKSRS